MLIDTGNPALERLWASANAAKRPWLAGSMPFNEILVEESLPS